MVVLTIHSEGNFWKSRPTVSSIAKPFACAIVRGRIKSRGNQWLRCFMLETPQESQLRLKHEAMFFEGEMLRSVALTCFVRIFQGLDLGNHVVCTRCRVCLAIVGNVPLRIDTQTIVEISIASTCISTQLTNSQVRLQFHVAIGIHSLGATTVLFLL